MCHILPYVLYLYQKHKKHAVSQHAMHTLSVTVHQPSTLSHSSRCSHMQYLDIKYMKHIFCIKTCNAQLILFFLFCTAFQYFTQLSCIINFPNSNQFKTRFFWREKNPLSYFTWVDFSCVPDTYQISRVIINYLLTVFILRPQGLGYKVVPPGFSSSRSFLFSWLARHLMLKKKCPDRGPAEDRVSSFSIFILIILKTFGVLKKSV